MTKATDVQKKLVKVPKGGPGKGKLPGGNMACCYGRGIMPNPDQSQKKVKF